MVYRILVLALVIVAAWTTMNAQDESYETFNAIRLENSSNPGQSITLSAPTGITPYSIILPATTAPTGDSRRYSFSKLATDGGLSWYATPYGADESSGVL